MTNSLKNSTPPSESRRSTAKSAGSGPKTEAGKRRVRLNAVKGGFYAKELMVKEDEKPAFEAARTALQQQFRPSTPMQQIGFERIVCCTWRIRLATRMEARRLNFQFDLQDHQDGLAQSTDEEMESPQWYGSGRADLQAASKSLLELRKVIKSSGSLYFEEWKDFLVKAFGPAFYDSLFDWSPVNADAIMLDEVFQAHDKDFVTRCPNLGLPEGTKVPTADPRSRWDMMLKIVDIQLQHVRDVRCLFDVRKGIEGLQDSVAVDAGARYYTTASRDLERAVAWYQELLERGL